MWPAFPASDYYGSSAPSRRHQPTMSLPASQHHAGRGGGHRDGSHVHLQPFDGVGAQLCPCNIATTTPQTFTVASRPATSTSPGVLRARGRGCALLPSPDLPDWSWWDSLEERSTAGFSRTPSHLACRAQAIWQCWPASSLSGLLTTHCVHLDAQAAPSLHRPAATDRPRCPFITARFADASWRSVSHEQASV